VPDTLDNRRWKRILAILAIAALVEFCLMVIGYAAPATINLIQPAYLIVAVVTLLVIWQSAWRRGGGDRRQDERRDSDAPPDDRGNDKW
jgi:fatty acid desaturase